MNIGEYGVELAFSTGFDMSSKTSLSISFWKPSNPWSEDTNSTPSLTAVPTLGVADLDTTAGTFIANEYVTYAFTTGQLDEAGTWSSRVTYIDSTQKLISDVGTFPVGD